MKDEDHPYFVLIKKVKTFQEKGLNTISFTYEDVINKFSENPKCYLSGQPVNWQDGSTYQLDHVIPKSDGGLSNLDNLNLLDPICNQMKYVWDIPLMIKVMKSIIKYQSENPEIVPAILKVAEGNQIDCYEMWEKEKLKKETKRFNKFKEDY